MQTGGTPRELPNTVKDRSSETREETSAIIDIAIDFRKIEYPGDGKRELPSSEKRTPLGLPHAGRTL